MPRPLADAGGPAFGVRRGMAIWLLRGLFRQELNRDAVHEVGSDVGGVLAKPRLPGRPRDAKQWKHAKRGDGPQPQTEAGSESKTLPPAAREVWATHRAQRGAVTQVEELIHDVMGGFASSRRLNSRPVAHPLLHDLRNHLVDNARAIHDQTEYRHRACPICATDGAVQ